MNSYACFGPSVNDKGLADDTIMLKIIKVKKQPVILRPVLRSKIFLVKTRAKVVETFVESVLF